MLKAEIVGRTEGPISAEYIVAVPTTFTEISDLAEALKVIEKFKKKALNVIDNISPADWETYDFKMDEKTIIVTIKIGACG
jgi:hypothetical protein